MGRLPLIYILLAPCINFWKEYVTLTVGHYTSGRPTLCLLPQYYIIEHVEQVIYADHPHEVDWVDKGSELDRLSKEYSEHLKRSNELRDKYMDLDTENAKLKEQVRDLEKRIRTENPEKRKIGTTKATIEIESEEFESLLKAIDFGAEWMNENGYSVQENKFKAIYDKLKDL